jgi:hypothetical protein
MLPEPHTEPPDATGNTASPWQGRAWGVERGTPHVRGGVCAAVTGTFF